MTGDCLIKQVLRPVFYCEILYKVHDRDTYWSTSIMRWDGGILHCSVFTTVCMIWVIFGSSKHRLYRQLGFARFLSATMIWPSICFMVIGQTERPLCDWSAIICLATILSTMANGWLIKWMDGWSVMMIRKGKFYQPSIHSMGIPGSDLLEVPIIY